MNNDLISRSELKENGTVIAIVNGEKMKVVPVKFIDNAPTVEPKQGEWLRSEFRTVYGLLGKFDYLCSRCTNKFDYPYPFCPNCGTKMEIIGLFK